MSEHDYDRQHPQTPPATPGWQGVEPDTSERLYTQEELTAYSRARLQADPQCMKSTVALRQKVEKALCDYHQSLVVGNRLGERLASLLDKWDKAAPAVTDKELEELIATMPIIAGFLRAQGMKPLARFYSEEFERMQECLRARHGR